MSDPTEQARAHFFAGNAHFEAGRLDAARADFEAALALAPGRASVLANLGVTLCRLRQWPDAITTLDAALLADPTHADAWAALGLCREATGQWAGAVHALQRAMDLGVRSGALQLSLAMCLQQDGHLPESLAALDEALAIDPALGEAWSQRGHLMREAGHLAEAERCYRQALQHGADDEFNRYCLAAVLDLPEPPAPPARYAETLFDEYADDFQDHLVAQLKYTAHETLLAPLLREGRRFAHVLDLGCGTGLCGQRIRDHADAVDGVDLAQAMVERSRASGAYRRVEQGDLLGFLQAQTEPADLVIAADVFIYVGALDAVFEAVRARLQPGACFAFSVELASDGSELKLLPSLRYAHSPAYIDRLAALNGFRVRQSWQAPLREDQQKPVMGLYVLLEPVASA